MTESGKALAFGQSWYDKNQFINILSEYQCQLNKNLEISNIYREEGSKIGYDVKIRDTEVSLKFKVSLA